MDMVSCLTLLQNAKHIITKCHSYYKLCCFLLQNPRVITKCDICYKMRRCVR